MESIMKLDQKIELRIHGMHCQSCEVLIERKFQKIEGVQKASVNHATGRASVLCSKIPRISDFQSAIRHDGYNVSLETDSLDSPTIGRQTTKRDYAETAIVFSIILIIAMLLKRFDLFPASLGFSENMSYGFVFLIGLVAAVSSCIAITGGLLLAVAAKYNEAHPNLTGAQRMKPHLAFNAGRILSYTFFGGLLGAFGSVFQVSTKTTGFMTIAASIVMIILGLQLLKIFPWSRKFNIRMPKFIAHRIHGFSNHHHGSGPFLLGSSTFFLPCGFTQALQLFVLSQGDFKTGALTMLAFSLGTLPALVSIGALTSFVKGSFQRYVFKVAGIAVILIGFANINNGFALTGNPIRNPWAEESKGQTAGDANVHIVNGVQVVDMKVVDYDYFPSQFTVMAGVPVEWNIDGSRSAGCAQVITAPDLDLTAYLPPGGVKKIRFTPQKVGKIEFYCSMGMTTPGAGFTVIPNDGSITPGLAEEKKDFSKTICDSTIMSCVSSSQRVIMEISKEKGFSPNVFQVKKDIPVEFVIDSKVPLKGCMGTLVIPEYDIAKRLILGKTTIQFTPTKVGNVPFTCSMGTVLGKFIVS